MGSAFFNIAHYEEAGVAYRQATQFDPSHFRAYAYQRKVLIEKGNALCQRGGYEEAISVYKDGILFDPNHANAYVGLGETLYKLERYEEAGAAYRRAIQLDKRKSKVSVERAKALVEGQASRSKV